MTVEKSDIKNKASSLILVFTSIIFTIFIIEIFLRFVPIKGVEMGTYVYDENIKLYKFNSNSKFVKTNIRNEVIIRNVNSQGFLDINHKKEKSKDSYRIGFFGDSYVESLQVPLEKTFFRVIDSALENKKIEIFGFGKSGHGTLHAYMISDYYNEYYDLDMVVYVFVENDLGDQIELIKKSPTLPYLEIKEGDLHVNDKAINSRLNNKSIKSKIMSSFIYRESIFLQTVLRRIKMLMDYGIKIKLNENDLTLSGIGDLKKIPNQNDLPSTWNQNYKNEAFDLGERMINKWYNECKLQNKKFALFYVPRASQYKKNIEEQDSWKFWLYNLCNDLKIDFIDPTGHFLKVDSSEGKIYDDHFSELGHNIFARSFLDWFDSKNIIKN